MLINNDLYIGNQTRFAFGSIICDTNFHYICDQGIIHRKVIKEHCSHIRSSKLEKEIDEFFKDNKEKTLYKFDMK